MKVNAVIVDDESLARSYLKSSIAEYCPGIHVIGEATGVSQAIGLILETKPEVIFLDVEMPGGDGFEVLKGISHERIPHTVFTTAHNRYAIRALKEGALDYLLKPINRKELQAAAARLEGEVARTKKADVSVEQLEHSISLVNQTGFSMVRLDQLVYLKADNNYTQLFLKDGAHLTSSQTLGNFESNLPGSWFFRIHRSYIINLYHLREYTSKEGGDVVMSNDARLPVARLRIPSLQSQVALLGPSIP